MKAQWKVPGNRPLADFAPTIILKAKDFATETTIFNARQHQMTSEGAISREHITNNQAVRNTLLERGIRPEHLPAAEDGIFLWRLSPRGCIYAMQFKPRIIQNPCLTQLHRNVVAFLRDES